MVYFISGLGADERIFQFLELKKLEHQYIKWLDPIKKEDLVAYCHRLIAQINLSEPIILVGVSFGGIVAQEISKIIDVEKVIIISSIKTSDEFSRPLQLLRKLQLHPFVPSWLMKIGNKYTADYYFSTQTPEESKLLHQIIADTDPRFLTWAIHVLMNWKNDDYPPHFIHIHGTSDRIFPFKKIQKAIEIPSGGHFMMVNKAAPIQQLIFAAINFPCNEQSK